MADVASAVAGTVADFFPAAVEAAQHEELNSEEVGAPETVPEPKVEKHELPDDIAELLEGPDDDDEDEPVNLEEYQDADELARELAKLKKKNKWLEEQNLARGLKDWRKEAIDHFDYINRKNVGQIKGNSRRSFIRAAAALNEQIHDAVQPVLADQVKKAMTEAQQAKAQKREADAAAWGKPVTGGAPAPAMPETTAQDRLDQARARRDLRGAIAATIELSDL